MGLFSKRIQNTRCGAIVDIGSGSVAVSIVLSEKKKTLPDVLYIHREFMSIRAKYTPEDHVRAMRHALFSTMLELEQNGMRALYKKDKRLRIENILVSCGAPWSYTTTQIIHFEQKTPFTTTPKLIEDIIARAYETEKAHGTDDKKIAADTGQQLVEKLIVDITLNGYHVQNPYHKEVSEITIAHLRGLVPISILTALEDIERHMHQSIALRVHTSALILYCVLRDLYPLVTHAMIVDISGEATEVTLIQDTILYETATLEVGAHAIIRDIATLSHTIPEEARGYLRAYAQGSVPKSHAPLLAQAQKTYADQLEQVMRTLTVRYVLPQTIFVILDQPTKEFFVDSVASATKQATGRETQTIIPLSPEAMRELVTLPAEVPIDPRLALAARFFHKLHTCDEIDTYSK